MAENNKNINIILNSCFEFKGKKYNWLNEIGKCVSFTNYINISVAVCIKEIMLRNEIPLTYGNIEKVKFEIVRFVRSKRDYDGLLGFSRASEILLTKEDMKYIPIVDDYWRSHLYINEKVWEAYRNKKS